MRLTPFAPFALILTFVVLFCLECRADPDHCAICGHVLDKQVYILTDKVTGEKTHVCPDCADLPNDCFECGLPVKEGYTELPDGRLLCARDAKNAVLDQKEAEKLVEQVKDNLDRLFS